MSYRLCVVIYIFILIITLYKIIENTFKKKDTLKLTIIGFTSLTLVAFFLVNFDMFGTETIYEKRGFPIDIVSVDNEKVVLDGEKSIVFNDIDYEITVRQATDGDKSCYALRIPCETKLLFIKHKYYKYKELVVPDELLYEYLSYKLKYNDYGYKAE